MVFWKRIMRGSVQPKSLTGTVYAFPKHPSLKTVGSIPGCVAALLPLIKRPKGRMCPSVIMIWFNFSINRDDLATVTNLPVANPYPVLVKHGSASPLSGYVRMTINSAPPAATVLKLTSRSTSSCAANQFKPTRFGSFRLRLRSRRRLRKFTFHVLNCGTAIVSPSRMRSKWDAMPFSTFIGGSRSLCQKAIRSA